MAEHTREELDLMSAMLRPALEASYRLSPEEKARHAICLLCYTLYRLGQPCCEAREQAEAAKAEEKYERLDLAKSILEHLSGEGVPMTPAVAKIVDGEVDNMLDRTMSRITTRLVAEGGHDV